VTKAEGDRPYHRGNLRALLLAAAEAELADSGIETFSLRRVARRAGVSHAAPAHHFGDVSGMLTALSAEGFARLLAMQREEEARAADEPRAQLVAAGCGYVRFAIGNPALFRLMFASDRPDHSRADLGRAAQATFDHLLRRVAAMTDGGGPPSRASVVAAWSAAHGLADLIVSKRSPLLASLGADPSPDTLCEILERLIPDAFPPSRSGGPSFLAPV